MVAERRPDATARPFLLRRLLFLEMGQLKPGGSCNPNLPCQLAESLSDLVARARDVGLTVGQLAASPPQHPPPPTTTSPMTATTTTTPSSACTRFPLFAASAGSGAGALRVLGRRRLQQQQQQRTQTQTEVDAAEGGGGGGGGAQAAAVVPYEGGANVSWHGAWISTGFGLNWDKPPLAEGCGRHKWEPTVACPKLGDGKHTAALVQYFRRASAIDQVSACVCSACSKRCLSSVCMSELGRRLRWGAVRAVC